MEFPILSLMLAVPLVGAIACLFLGAQSARMVALVATLANLALGVVLWLNYDIGGAQWQFVERAEIFAGFSYALGIDGIALMLIMLSVFLMPICILASWDSITKRVGEYMSAFLLMEVLMIGVFAAQDMFLFYIFFEAGLIPMYLIIGVWGGDNRIYASYKFFLYTLLGSVLMLIAMMWMVNEAGTTDIPRENADVAGAHVVAGRTRPGADRRFRDPGGCFAEARWIRFYPVQPADVPGSQRSVYLAGFHPVDDCRDLHFARRSRAERHEETDRLLLGRPYGDRNRRSVRLQCAGA